MNLARRIVDEVRSLKTDNKIKLRWPTKALNILPKEKMSELIFKELIQQMTNVKEVSVIKKTLKGDNIKETEIKECNLLLDLEDTSELQQERIIRDLMRNLQSLRKQAGLKTGEAISLQLSTNNDFAYKALETHKDALISKVTAEPLNIDSKVIKKESDSTYHDFHLC
ncbi:MAG: hypothetical protein GY870_10445, partial [archaeon]|nr:hypothetical protein [archaeon]